MKKLVYICALAAIAATAFSCSKESAPVKMKTISVDLECPQVSDLTKTYLSGENIMWRGEDTCITCITDGTKGENWFIFHSSTKTAARTKTFVGSIPDGQSVVCYTYYENKNNTGGMSKYTSRNVVRYLLPRNQSCWSYNSFPQTYNFAVAGPDGSDFQSAVGYFKWTNDGKKIKSVKFETVTEHEYFAGYVDATYNTATGVVTAAKYVYQEDNESSCSPYVTCTDPHSSISADQSYYACIIPGTYHGMKMTITLAAGGEIAFTSNAEFTVHPGKYIDLGVLRTTAL